MAKGSKKKPEEKLGFKLSREEFVAITAVEGLKLSPEAEQRLKDTEGMTPEERVAVIIGAYKARRHK
jgi:hypothetical protein